MVYLYSAHRAVIFAIAQLSCYILATYVVLMSWTFRTIFLYTKMVTVSSVWWFDLLLFWYSDIGGLLLLLLLHVSNKRALHAKWSFTIVYDPMTWYLAVW